MAGGRGTRLSPITDSIPKPLVPIHGRPFLSYHLDQLKAQGIQDVLILTGYLAGQISGYCGDGSQWGLRISYSESSVEAETGARIRDAASQIESHFLLMYCDNLWPLSLSHMWRSFKQSGAAGQITVYANRDGYSRDNVRLDGDGFVAVYDPSRTSPNLSGVEIGYGVMSKKVLDHLPEGNVSFEHTVYPALAGKRLLGAYRTEHRYYSIGSHERLPLTEAYLEPQKAVILDRDGVLNVRPPQAHYVRCWEEFQWLPGAKDALRMLTQAGYKLILATNQSGIARGEMNDEQLAKLHHTMTEEIRQAGANIDAIYHCPHGWDEGCFCRKPSPGMLFQAQRDFHLDLTNTLWVGDDDRDMEAGAAAGCQCVQVTDDRSLLDVITDYLSQGQKV